MKVKEELGCGISEPGGLSPNDAFECVMGQGPSFFYDFFAGLIVISMLLLYLIWINRTHKDFQSKKIEPSDFYNIIIYPPMLFAFVVAFLVFARP
ncbi:hypothetical protein [Shewanella glacialipiscicola]|uniref:hypothetical protein n=1 Tax=Shewanella glacialipiscicola TaxID=614069 RepID=UPI003D7930B2